jgi:hypothetical protein
MGQSIGTKLQPSINVSWVKCSDADNWCPLETVNLEKVSTIGVLHNLA